MEAEAIHVMREVVAQCERPVMLYSIGKDSSVMLHLARKAFALAPAALPLAVTGGVALVLLAPRLLPERLARPHPRPTTSRRATAATAP